MGKQFAIAVVAIMIISTTLVMPGVSDEGGMNDTQERAINEAMMMIIASHKCVKSMIECELPSVEELSSALEYSTSEPIKATHVSPVTGTASASTIYVPDNYSTIQAAVNAASPGDTVIVRDGTFIENIEVYKSLTIRSEKGPDSTVVRAEYPDLPVFEIAANYVNLSGFTVKGAYEDHGIYLYSADYCSISNNICSENEDGILLIVSENNNISNNDCYLNNDSISIFLSNSNNISNNVCSDNGDDGIDLIMSNSNNISNNVCSDNEDYGIKLHMSENNNISDNNCPSNSCSIFLTYSANNSVSGNVCSYSSACGIFIAESTNNFISNNHWTYNFVGIAPMNSSDNNSIFKNNCSENDMGIFPVYANNNNIYLNNFMNNDVNAGSYESSNTWSSPSKITYTYNGKTYTNNYLGNYWDDYSRSDRDEDGIGDSSYRIDGDRDRYPLMGPWGKYFA